MENEACKTFKVLGPNESIDRSSTRKKILLEERECLIPFGILVTVS